ncbi:transcription antitermination factor NusB [Corynebacterium kroppenstedtii]|uniref:transcription antitermination factor NusB n=1 Tax=Corynebacterium sp. PCR 32 TaxID=3351342 RepID=UPI0030AD7277
MYKRHGSRYKARRRAVDVLFEAEFRDQDPVAVVEQRRRLACDPESGVLPVADYTATIVSGVAENLDGIDSAIASHLSSTWRLDRIPAVDRAVMRVSTWELLHNDEVPPKVAVSEGIELASDYSTDVAPAYINAVLDDIATEVQRARSTNES